MKAGIGRCPGCDCKNATVEADWQGVTPHCCDAFDDIPYRYAVISECEITSSQAAPQVLIPSVMILQRCCLRGCKFGITTPENWGAVDMQANAVVEKWPPYKLDGGAISFSPADFGPNPSAGGPAPYCVANLGAYYSEYPGTTYTTSPLCRDWVLDLAADPVTLTWVGDPITHATLGLAAPAPQFEALGTWLPFGRNSMKTTETTRTTWPGFKHHICVVALSDGTGTNAPATSCNVPNKCDTAAHRCACCDNGVDYLPIVIDGDRSELVRVNPATYDWPCGTTAPTAAPCQVFVGEVGIEETCPGTETIIEKFAVVYCTGSTYAMDIYCKTTGETCWTQGTASVTNYECKCHGPRFDFTYQVPCCGCDCSEITDTTLTAELASDCLALDGLTITLTGGSGSWSGSAAVGDTTAYVSIDCNEDGDLIGSLSIPDCLEATATAATSLQCDPVVGFWENFVSVVGSCFGCSAAKLGSTTMTVT